MKKVIIISPNFPPVNAADMHRVRQSLPYLKALGWEAEVVSVDPAYLESYNTDELLLKTIPADTKVQFVKGWDVNKTRKFGLGSIGMRTFFQYKQKVNELLRTKKYDLIFFSTTAFHLMALGPYWKRKFKIPFVLDIQDPWRNDFYLTKPKHERPPKFFIAYSIDKYLEAKTIPVADAIISVSQAYCDTFRSRYPHMKASCSVIPFSGVPSDFDMVVKEKVVIEKVQLDEKKMNIVYVGRGGHDMKFVVGIFFAALKRIVESDLPFSKNIHCTFVGTSYAMKGTGVRFFQKLAENAGIDNIYTEITDRIPYFESLALLKKADILFVPGSTDTSYTASKIYPYVLAEKPLLTIFHQSSSVVRVLKDAEAGEVITFESESQSAQQLTDEVYTKLSRLIENRHQQYHYDPEGFKKYTAGAMTENLVHVFDEVVKNHIF